MPGNKNNKTQSAYLITVATSALLLCSTFTVSSGAIAYESDYLYDDIPVVLSANRLLTPQLDAPAAMTVIDREMIERSGARELTDILRLVPGMQVDYFSGHFPVVSYHGMSDLFSRRMQVLVDGSSVYLPSSGGVIWRDLPWQLEDIERIEVVRGPAAATYGPNSFLAVINIITRHSSLEPKMTIKATSGERDYRKLLLRKGGGDLNKSYRLNLAYGEDGGFEKLYDSQRTRSLNGRVDLRTGRNDELLLNFGYSEGLRNFLNADASQEREAFYSAFRWSRQTNANESFSLNGMYSYNRLHNRFTSNLGGGLFAFVDNSQRSERFDLEFQQTTSPKEELRVVWGAGIRKDQAMAPLWTGDNETKTVHLQRLFANAEWQIADPLILNAGFLAEHNSLSDIDLSPRLAFNYRFLPSHSLRVSASRTSRAPIVTEAYNNVSLNTNFGSQPISRSVENLENETSRYYEVGYHGFWLKNRLATDFKLFRQTFKRLISSDPLTPLPVLIDNHDSAIIKGVEMELDYRPSRDTLLHAGFSLTDIDNRTSIIDYSHSNPSRNFNLLFSTDLERDWRIGAFFYYRSDMEWQGTANRQSDFRQLDLNLVKSVRLSSTETIEASATLQLALDKNELMQSDITMENRAFFEIRYQYD